jgi:molybdate transport system substrate-binding protein
MRLPTLLALLLLACANAFAQLTVAAAANVQFALEELKTEFKQETGSEVQTVYGASGKLVTQIRNGAPFDVFISADTDFPDSLFKWGYAAAAPKTYAYGKLVLWTLKDIDLEKGIPALSDSAVAKIALADPKSAPYGRAAIKALQRSGLYEKLKPRLVYGDNISQVSQYVLTGNADIGFSAKSVVRAAEVRGKGKWREVDTTLYDKIAQAAAVCKYGREHHSDLSQRFFEFLYSAPARKIFSAYGYELP